MAWPTFAIIGAAKAGTSALYLYASQHPEIYTPPGVKETNFFALGERPPDFRGPGDEQWVRTSIHRRGDYLALFDAPEARAARATGEASPLYLYHPAAPAAIRRHAPSIRLVAVLRNPVDRAFSSYLHTVREGRETASFEQALRLEQERIDANWEFIWHHRAVGLYAAQLRRYLEAFGSEQLLVVTYEEFRQRPVEVMREVFVHLGVDPDFVPDMRVHPNATGVPRNRALHGFLANDSVVKRALRPLLPAGFRSRLNDSLLNRNLQRPEPAAETRAALARSFAAEIRDVGAIVGRDLEGLWT